MIINFKTYKEATGGNAVKLARIADEAARGSGVNIIAAVQPADIYRVSQAVSIPVFAQHVDPVGYGRHTGHVTPESVKENGASGTLLNHAEMPMEFGKLGHAIEGAKKAGLVTVACVGDEKSAVSAAAFCPDMISIEPPELISTGVAASVVRPDVIANAVKMVRRLKRIRILCGAGIRKPGDVSEALKLGAKGILISSGIVLSSDPKAAIMEMAAALKSYSEGKEAA